MLVTLANAIADLALHVAIILMVLFGIGWLGEQLLYRLRMKRAESRHPTL
jgi:hypothetical protein